MRVTSAEIEAEIQRSLDFLETDLRDVPQRQRSIRAVFDHSWRLLDERTVAVHACASRYGFAANSGWFQEVVDRPLAALAARLPAETVAVARERGQARD